jgi:hypothetical protein
MTPRFDSLINEIVPVIAAVAGMGYGLHKMNKSKGAASCDAWGISQDHPDCIKHKQNWKGASFVDRNISPFSDYSKHMAKTAWKNKGHVAKDLIPGGSSKKVIGKGYKMARKAGVSKNVARVGAQVAGAADRTMRA